MMYKLVITREVSQQIRGLPGYIRAIAKQQIADLSKDPRPAQSKQLTGYPNHYRVWLDKKYRLIWHVMDDERLVEFDYVGLKTPDLYARLGLGR
jgi:mRNA interferase RelE/StbE